jgi:hypothetical protein
VGLYFPFNNGWSLKGEGMGYKKWGKEISFADLAVSKSLEHNRSLQMMKSIDKSPTRRVYDPEGL